MKKTNSKAIVLSVVCVIVLMALLPMGIYTVSESQVGVVLTFGKPTSTSTPGLHFKIPFIQTVRKVDTTIKGFDVGYTTSTDTTSGTEQTVYTSTPDSMMITSDYNFISVDFYVEYRVTDPVKSLYNSQDPELILRNVVQNSIRTTIGSYTVDSVLTTGKNEIQSNIFAMITEKLEKYDLGIQLVAISMQDAEPPTVEISEAFKAVETAKQGKETAVNNANKYRNEQIPAANAEADRIIQQAEADKQQRINEATGQASRFLSEYEEYQKYPEVTRQRMFYETMEDVLPDMKVIIESDSGSIETIMPIDAFSGSDNKKASVASAADSATDD